MTDYFRLTGDSEQAVACGERALAFAIELKDFSLQSPGEPAAGACLPRGRGLPPGGPVAEAKRGIAQWRADP